MGDLSSGEIDHDYIAIIIGAEFAEDVEVDTDSHIITLSTCVGDETRRLLIVAAEQPPQTGESGTE